MNTLAGPVSKNLGKDLLRNPTLLLVSSGILVGLSFPLAKIANEQTIPASLWVAINSLGASLALLVILLRNKNFRIFKKREFRYTAIAGPLTFAGPSMIVFIVVPEVGSAVSGVLFSLSPVFTALLARAAKLEKLSKNEIIGILFGLCGAIGISVSQGRFVLVGEWLWLGLAMLLPVMLAAGNIYRSIDWPRGSPPELLAFWSHLIAFLVYSIYTLLSSIHLSELLNEQTTAVITAQLTIGAITAPLVFRLQLFGGPILLSQIGYIAAVTSVVLAVSFLGEYYPIASLISSCLVMVGIVINLQK